jgi:hypothetical protein
MWIMAGVSAAGGMALGLLDRIRAFLPARAAAAAPRAVLAMLPLLLLADFGYWTRTEVLKGPFQPENAAWSQGAAATNKMLVVPVAPALGCCLTTSGNFSKRPQQSQLQVTVNGLSYATPHGYHDRMRAGEAGVFDHWTDGVRLALPEGTANTAQTEIRLSYPLRASRALSGVVTAAFMAAVGVLALTRTAAQLTAAAALPGSALLALTRLGLAAGGVYLAATVYGWLTGAYLPTAAVMRLPGAAVGR